MEEFWFKLMMDIKIQMIDDERSGFGERHGRKGGGWQKVIDTVTEIGVEIDTTGRFLEIEL